MAGDLAESTKEGIILQCVENVGHQLKDAHRQNSVIWTFEVPEEKNSESRNGWIEWDLLQFRVSRPRQGTELCKLVLAQMLKLVTWTLDNRLPSKSIPALDSGFEGEQIASAIEASEMFYTVDLVNSQAQRHIQDVD